jgi:hypothetical protein
VVERDRQAHGQRWALADARQLAVGHPHCVRSLIPFLEAA